VLVPSPSLRLEAHYHRHPLGRGGPAPNGFDFKARVGPKQGSRTDQTCGLPESHSLASRSVFPDTRRVKASSIPFTVFEMRRASVLAWVVRMSALGLLLGMLSSCGGSGSSGGAAPFECEGTASECLNQLAGVYSGSYSGDTHGTWEATVSPGGDLSGTAHNAVDGSDYSLTGTADESGRMVFGTASDGTAFSGQVAVDFTIRGTWTLGGHSGTFSGRRTSELSPTGGAAGAAGE